MSAQWGAMEADASHVSELLRNIILNQTVDERWIILRAGTRTQGSSFTAEYKNHWAIKAKLSYFFGLKYCSAKVHGDFCLTAFMGPELNYSGNTEEEGVVFDCILST